MSRAAPGVWLAISVLSVVLNLSARCGDGVRRGRLTQRDDALLALERTDVVQMASSTAE